MIPHQEIDGPEHKRCGKCKEWKQLIQYNNDKNSRDGLRCTCKECMVLERKKRKKYIQAYNKRYWKHRDKEVEKNKKRRYRAQNREELRKKNKEWRSKTAVTRKKREREYRTKNWEKIKKRNKEWRRKTGYERKKRKNDPHFRIKSNLSRRLREQLNKKKGKTVHYVGCSILKLTCHIERQFSDIMSWRQFHLLHVDHRVPCKAWDLSSPLDQRVCFWYKNLQPLFAKDNIKKKDKYKEEDKQALIKEFIFYNF